MLAEFGTGQVFLSILWFFLFFIWIMLLFYVFADIFTDSEMGGWGKALWSIFVILVPYLGVLIYLIVRGSKMRENAMARAKAQDQAQREYIRSAVSSGGASTADELAKLADLKANGTLSEAEFEAAKKNLLA
jgi:ABC-type multidrug transport system fused ATPase/permease subunit